MYIGGIPIDNEVNFYSQTDYHPVNGIIKIQWNRMMWELTAIYIYTHFTKKKNNDIYSSLFFYWLINVGLMFNVCLPYTHTHKPSLSFPLNIGKA